MSSRLNKVMPRFQYLLLTTALVTCATYSVQAAELVQAPGATGAWSSFKDEYGNISIDTSLKNQTLINQSGNLYIGTSKNLDINANQSVTIGQDDSNALFVAKSANGADPTRILGSLSTRTKDAQGNFTNNVGGSVMILDANGIFFGKDAVIDMHGIVASTGKVDNKQLIEMAAGKKGRVTLSDLGDGQIINNGTISISEGGLAAFVAPGVVNNGIITAKAGRVELAASNTVTTLDMYGDGLVEIAVNDKNTAALLAENSGTINAEGGIVHMTTGAAEKVVNAVINMDGVITASSVSQKGGKIILGGANTGKVNIDGEISVDSKGAKIGNGGTVTVKAKEVDVKKTAVVSADGSSNTGDGGAITFIGENAAILNGRVRARGGKNGGNGGSIELSTDGQIGLGGSVDTTAEKGKTGTFLIDPRDLEIIAGTNSGGMGIYESDLEALSATTDLDLMARRNISVNASGITDGTLSIANGHNLTIRTTNAPTLTELDNTGSINLTGLAFETTGNGNITIAATNGNVILNNALTTNGGDVDITGNNVQLLGTSSINADDINFVAGNVFQADTSTIAGDVLTAQVQTSAYFGGTNNDMASIGDFATGMNGTTGGLSYNDKNNINLNGAVSSNGGGIGISSTGQTINGSIVSKGGNINMYSVNGNLAINGTVNAGTGDVDIITQAVSLNGTSLISADDININASSVSQSAPSRLIGDVLTANVTGALALNGTDNDIASIGKIDAGSFSFNDVNRIDVNGAVTTTGGNLSIISHHTFVNAGSNVKSNNGNITLDGKSVGLTIGGNVDAGTGDIDLKANSAIVLTGTGSVKGDDINLAGSSVSQSSASKITGDVLTGNVTGNINMLGDNDMANIGDLSAGGISYKDINNLNVNGNVTTSGGGVALYSQGQTLNGTIDTNNGNLTIYANSGDLNVNGTVKTGSNTTFIQGKDIKLNNGSSIAAGNIQVQGSSLTETGTAKITGTTLSGNVTGNVNMLGDNDMTTINGLTAGDVSYKDINNLNIGNLTTNGGGVALYSVGQNINGTINTNNGNLTVYANSGDLNVNGTIKTGSNTTFVQGKNIKLNNGSSIAAGNVTVQGDSLTETGTAKITGANLSGTVAGNIVMLGDNDMTSIGNLSAGSISYKDINNLNVGNLTTNGGGIALYSQGQTINGTINTNNGNLTVYANGGDLNVNGTIKTGSNTTFIQGKDIKLNNGSSIAAGNIQVQGSSLTETGTAKITGTTLSGTVTGNVAMLGDNDMTTINGLTVGGLSYKDINNLNVVNVTTTGGGAALYSQGQTINGTVDTNGGNLTVYANGGDLNINGAIKTGGNTTFIQGKDIKLNNGSSIAAGNVQVQGSSLTESGSAKITGTTLSGTVTGNVNMLGDNDMAGIGNLSAGNIAYKDINNLNVDGNVTTNGGGIALYSQGQSINGTVKTNNGNLTVYANGGELTVNGTVNTGNGNTFLQGKGIGFANGSTTSVGNLQLQAGTVNEGTTAKITGNTLTGSVTNTASLNGQNDFISIGDFTTGIGASTGGFVFNDINGVIIDGDISSDGGDIAVTGHGVSASAANNIVVKKSSTVTSLGGNITLNAADANLVVNEATIDAASGNINMAGKKMELNGKTIVKAGALDFTGTSVSQEADSKIVADTLTGSLKQNAVLTSLKNNVQKIGNFFTGLGASVGGFAFNDVNGVNVEGNVTSDGGDVIINANSDITNTGNIVLKNGGSITSNGGNVSLDAKAGDLRLNDTASIDAGAGDLTLNASAIAFNNKSTITADDVSLTSASVFQGANSVLTANTLTGQVQTTAILTGNNDINTLNAFATGLDGTLGGFAFNDTDDLTVAGDVTSNGGDVVIIGGSTIINSGVSVLSNGGDMAVAGTSGSLQVFGTVNAGAGDMVLIGANGVKLKNGSFVNADELSVIASDVDQQANSQILARTLSGAVNKDANFNGKQNDIEILKDFTTGLGLNHKGGFTLVDNNGLNVRGTVSADNVGNNGDAAINIKTKGGVLNFAGVSDIETNGGAFTATSNRRIDFDNGAQINLGSGDAFIDAPRVNLAADINTTGTIDGTADIVNVLNDTAQIQDGVDVAANAATLNVSAGNYAENVVVDKSLTILGVQAGVDARGRTGLSESIITGGLEVQADNTTINGFEVTGGFGPGIFVNNAVNTNIVNNNIHDVVGDAIAANGATTLTITNNQLSNNVNGVNITLSDAATIENNLVEGSGNIGIRTSGSTGTTLSNNELNNNATGIEVAGMSIDASSDTTILSNGLTGNDIGLKTTGAGVGDVLVADNAFLNNIIGMLFEGGAIDISELGAPNSIIGGTTGMRFDPTAANNPLSLANNSLGTTLFSGQIGNYIELMNGALFNPGTPTVIDGLSASFDGIIPANAVLGAGLLTAVERLAIEAKLVDYDDSNGLGQILVGLNLNTNQEDLFALNLYSLQPQTGNVRLTVLGLPRVSLSSPAALAAIAPAAGAARFASAEDFANVEPAAGGNGKKLAAANNNGEDLAGIEPAAGAEGCWASLGASTGTTGAVTYSFGPDVNSAIKDSSCAN